MHVSRAALNIWWKFSQQAIRIHFKHIGSDTKSYRFISTQSMVKFAQIRLIFNSAADFLFRDSFDDNIRKHKR